ncbi:MotA/TolQ/ExbB proton channel family protein [Microbulbifer donghaiensis]|uniref:MotA/TolQ/ExbB proton channel family protein n=1 Tax=Microbulbifer donghaiensis TaxID=494016 RepID=A0A1M5D972_9GAMM|nr:MotA/TolQ/ExbB proton channel family protein [Microbulbifer donghaiensis]SHF63182.1 MotA/TolQ/ExbB proton channel family protein [Microbulbifer donghaiensis]
MSGLLHQVFLSLTPAAVTDGFLVLMLAIFALALILRFIGRGREFVEQGPGFLTSLGILGTFIGIIIGLYDFSLEEIDRSIADLMAGLKTAFITSVIGLALSLLLRVFSRMLRLPTDPVQGAATIDDLNNNLLQLHTALESFTQRTSEELVSRLENVVAEFNLRIQSQFGDNLQGFCTQLADLQPALATAAGEYRAHADRVESWSRRCDESQQTLINQQTVLKEMYDRIAELPRLYSGLDQLLERQGQQTDQLARILGAQHESVQQLAALVPQLPQNIEQLSQGVVAAQKGVDENLAAINAVLQSQTQSLAERFQHLSSALDNLKALDPEAMQDLVNASAQSHRESMRELAQMIAATHREMLQALAEVIRKELKDADVSIRRQYEQMDRVMAAQVEQVLAAMGEALATVSGNFTRDYQKLLAQMRRLQVREADYAE